MGQGQSSGTLSKAHLNLLEMYEISFFEPRTIVKHGIWGHQVKVYNEVVALLLTVPSTVQITF